MRVISPNLMSDWLQNLFRTVYAHIIYIVQAMPVNCNRRSNSTGFICSDHLFSI